MLDTKPDWFKVGKMVYVGKVDIALKIIGITDSIALLEEVGHCPIIGLTEAIIMENGQYKRGQSYRDYENEKSN